MIETGVSSVNPQSTGFLQRFTRMQVFSVHLGISVLIFSALAAAMLLHWFPGPFFATDGGWQGMRIIAAVDLVLGPSLTLIFFNPKGKRHGQLLFDLSTIAVVQLIALVWGTWTVYNERTVAITFSKNQFFSISHGALAEANDTLREAGKETVDIRDLSDTHPRQIFVTAIQPDELGKYLADIFNGLPEVQLRTDRYTDITPHWDEIAGHAVDVRAFAAEHEEVAPRVEKIADRLETLEFYPLRLRFSVAIAGFDKQTRELEHIFPYQPPKTKEETPDDNRSDAAGESSPASQ